MNKNQNLHFLISSFYFMLEKLCILKILYKYLTLLIRNSIKKRESHSNEILLKAIYLATKKHNKIDNNTGNIRIQCKNFINSKPLSFIRIILDFWIRKPFSLSILKLNKSYRVE